MMSKNERRRKRYAEDPVFRAKVLEGNHAFYEKNGAKINEAARLRRKSDPEFREKGRLSNFQHKLKHTYGMTLEDHHRMLAQQQGLCKICNRRKSDQSLCIDHCHSTRKVRGLLCSNCNTGLGLYDDNPDLLREAAAYLDAARGLPRCIVIRTAEGRKPKRLAFSSMSRIVDGEAVARSPARHASTCRQQPRWHR
jgi:hypothetical protein